MGSGTKTGCVTAAERIHWMTWREKSGQQNPQAWNVWYLIAYLHFMAAKTGFTFQTPEFGWGSQTQPCKCWERNSALQRQIARVCTFFWVPFELIVFRPACLFQREKSPKIATGVPVKAPNVQPESFLAFNLNGKLLRANGCVYYKSIGPPIFVFVSTANQYASMNVERSCALLCCSKKKT